MVCSIANCMYILKIVRNIQYSLNILDIFLFDIRKTTTDSIDDEWDEKSLSSQRNKSVRQVPIGCEAGLLLVPTVDLERCLWTYS